MVNKKTNTNLHTAKSVKNDEFYTRFEDISKEVTHYKEFFKDKVVYCNCDRVDGDNRSNFFVYFATYFEILGLKRLICTTYNKGGKGRLFIYDGDTNGNKFIDDEEIYTIEMDGDGDFRSEECVKWLKKCDVVVTNPPFSLFREFVAQLTEYDKKFLIVGNKNAITYKEIFPLIKDNKLWLGINAPKAYSTPLKEVENEKTQYKENGVVYQKFGNHGWFTNIEHSNRIYPLDLYKRYDAEKYPKYDNYDAINVDKVTDIPCDYNGVMGVPVTFLDKYCPTQFEIVGMAEDNGKGQSGKANWDGLNPHCVINGENKYKRIFILKII